MQSSTLEEWRAKMIFEGLALAALSFAVYAQARRGQGASAGVNGLGDFGLHGFTGVADDMDALSRWGSPRCLTRRLISRIGRNVVRWF